MQDALLRFIERRRWWLVAGCMLLAVPLYLYGDQMADWLDTNGDRVGGLKNVLDLAQIGALVLAALLGLVRRTERDAQQQAARLDQVLQAVRVRAEATVQAMLAQSMEHRLALPVHRRRVPLALQQAWSQALVDPLHGVARVDPDAPLATLFDQSGSALLLLGEAGAGKTVALLQLAEALLARSRADAQAPVPLYLTLSAWADPPGGLQDWLAGQLVLYYAIPQALGAAWIADGRIVLLLDGLDEVAPARRRACAEALNRLRADLGVTAPLAVACRSADYASLPPLALGAAIELLPLPPELIDAHLAQRPEPGLASLRALLAGDAGWRALAQSPLMLGVMTVAFAAADAGFARDAAALAPPARAALLWDRYLAEALRRKEAAAAPATDRQLRQLGWLARAMRARSSSVLHLEQLDAGWAPRVPYLAIGLGLGLLVGALGGLIGTGLIQARWFGRELSLAQAAFVGAGFGLLMATFMHTTTGPLTTRQVWRAAQLLRPATLLTGSAALVLGLLVTVAVHTLIIVQHLLMFAPQADLLVGALQQNMTWDKLVVLWVRVGPALLLLLVIGGGITNATPTAQAVPNEGMRARLALALRFGPPVALAGLAGVVLEGLWLHDLPLAAMGEDWRGWIGQTLALLVTCFLAVGGLDVVRHGVVRAALASSGRLPWRLVALLEQATRWVLMQRVGGGFRFVHGELAAHLAEHADDAAWRGRILARATAAPPPSAAAATPGAPA